VVRFWLERDRSPCRGASGEGPARESRCGLRVTFGEVGYCVGCDCCRNCCEADEVLPWAGRVALNGGYVVGGRHGRVWARGSIGYG
jgi:hypothetical protein